MLVEIARAPLATQDLSAHRIATMPVLVLDLHSRCNCRCVMCDIWRRDASSELPFEMLTRNRDSLRALKVEWVVLTGGEPLMHSSFEKVCKFLREEGIRITLLTAGLTLHKRAREVAYNVDDIIVSLDGPREIHDHVRGVKGAYGLLATGVLSLLSLRPELRISARTTVQKANHTSLIQTVAAAQELDVSGISFLAADLTSTAFNRNVEWAPQRQDDVALNAAEVEALDVEIAELIASRERDIAGGYIAESPAKLRRLVAHFRAHLCQVAPEAPRCNAPWVSAVIGPDGSVQPCFFHRAIGNLHDQSLQEVANGSSALEFRSSLDMEANPTCQNCVCSLYRQPGEAR
jgi:MoaA/NifB/PqqE/SkfB family radical SAM enzyme